MYPMQVPAPPVPPPSTRLLTVTKWITVGVSVLLTGLAVLWVAQLHRNVDVLAAHGGLLDDREQSIARAETHVVIAYTTLVGIALIGVAALLAGTGQRWARVLCVLLLCGPMGVIVYGVVDGGDSALYALAFLVPFGALLLLWCLPGVSRGLAVIRARRRAPRAEGFAWR